MCCCTLVHMPGVSAVSWDALTPGELDEPEESVRKEYGEIWGCLCSSGLGSVWERAGRAVVHPHSRVKMCLGSLPLAVLGRGKSYNWHSALPTPSLSAPSMHSALPPCPGPTVNSAVWLWAAKIT